MQSYSTHSPETICTTLERWSGWTHHDIDSDKTIVDTVNALVVVAAFIAGVQSQIISFTMSLPKSSLGNATNALAFVGLLLDVIGTFLGVIHAMVLQRRIKENTSVLNAMTQISTSLRAIQRLASATSTDKQVQLREMGIDDPERQIRRARELLDALESRFHSRSVAGPFTAALGVLQAVVFPHPANGIDKEQFEALVRSLFGLGHTPLLAMALGVVALVVSIIMFAAESTELSSDVWVSCVAVLSSVIGLSLLPITYTTAKNYFHPGSRERLPE